MYKTAPGRLAHARKSSSLSHKVEIEGAEKQKLSCERDVNS